MEDINFEIKDGFVKVPVATYKAMREQLEDLHDEAALKHALANIEEFFPDDVVGRLLAGENPVKVFRGYRQMNQTALAQAVGVSQATIAEIETGKRDGSIKTIKAIAAALAVDIDDLV